MAAECTFTYDPEADAAYIYFGPTRQKSAGTFTVGPPGTDMFADVDAKGALIGIEILNGKKLPKAMRKTVGVK
jgi:uncharacterized protein YuzE